MFLGKETGLFENFERRVQTGQRRVWGKGLGSCLRQASQMEWPQGRTRGTAESAAYGCRQTGHSGGSTFSMAVGAGSLRPF